MAVDFEVGSGHVVDRRMYRRDRSSGYRTVCRKVGWLPGSAHSCAHPAGGRPRVEVAGCRRVLRRVHRLGSVGRVIIPRPVRIWRLVGITRVIQSAGMCPVSMLSRTPLRV
eukprot:1241587-Pyramimonas_sp.AAC.1